MTLRANFSNPSLRVATAPTYLLGRSPREAWAHFGSGAVVRVVRGRSRSYPGLVSEAPATRPFYDAFCQALDVVDHVIDFGCGVGEGTLRLTEQFDRVTGIDNDGEALAFAREYAPLGLFLKHDLKRPLDTAAADAGVVVDVLGHVVDPEVALSNIRRALRSESKLLVAEATAFPTQTLTNPARRAFSKRSLKSLLVRSGFQVHGWVCESGSFIACMAQPRHDEETKHLLNGMEFLRQERPELAAASFARAADSCSPGLKLEATLAEAAARFTAGDGDGAARALFNARELDVDDPRPLVGLSRLALATHQIGDALTLAVDAAERDPTDATAAQAVALAAEAARAPEALDAWRVAFKLTPSDAGVASKVARLAADRGDFALCTSVLERIRDYGEDGGPAFHVTMAWAYLAQGRQADATLEAQFAVRLAPNDPTVLDLWSALSRTDSDDATV